MWVFFLMIVLVMKRPMLRGVDYSEFSPAGLKLAWAVLLKTVHNTDSWSKHAAYWWLVLLCTYKFKASMGAVHTSLLMLFTNMFSPGVCECLRLSSAEADYTEGTCLQDQKCAKFILSSLVPRCSVYTSGSWTESKVMQSYLQREHHWIYIWLL